MGLTVDMLRLILHLCYDLPTNVAGPGQPFNGGLSALLGPPG